MLLVKSCCFWMMTLLLSQISSKLIGEITRTRVLGRFADSFLILKRSQLKNCLMFATDLSPAGYTHPIVTRNGRFITHGPLVTVLFENTLLCRSAVLMKTLRERWSTMLISVFG